MVYPSQGVKYAHTPKPTPFYVQGVRTPVAFGDITKALLYKTFDSEKHLVRIPRASIGLDVSVMERAIELGLIHIRCTDTRTGKIYTTTLETFQKKGFPVRRGYGNQWALALDWWSIDGKQPEAEKRAEAEAIKAETAKIQQGSLFGGD